MTTMTEAAKAKSGPLIDFLGRNWTLDVPVSAAIFNSSSSTAAFTLVGAGAALARCTGDDLPAAGAEIKADGTIEITPNEQPPAPMVRLNIHDGADLALTAAADDGFLSAGPDGRVTAVRPDGEQVEHPGFAGRPVSCLAVDGKRGRYACALGREVHLLGPGGVAAAVTFEHDKPVTGLAFDPRGARLAAADDEGVTLWWADQTNKPPRRLDGPGGHRAVAWSPDNRYLAVVSGQSLHAWRLSDGADWAMAGYGAAPGVLSWSQRSRFLVADGAPQVLCWPIAAATVGQPLSPDTLGIPSEILVTSVACHPLHDTIAAGYANGAVLLCRHGKTDVVFVKGLGDGVITTVAWSPDGRHLALGSDQGFAAVVSFPGGMFK